MENNSIGIAIDKDDTRLEVDQVTLRFIDLARQVEAFFLQKRFLLSALKPELIIKEDITDLKVELLRKEELIKKHYEKILIWQNLLAEMHGWVQPNGKIYCCYKRKRWSTAVKKKKKILIENFLKVQSLFDFLKF